MLKEHRNWLLGVGTICATYIYFLIYAQYGLLRWLKLHELSGASLDMVMAGMGSAGLMASFITAWFLGRQTEDRPAHSKFSLGKKTISLAFIGCSLSSFLTLTISSRTGFILSGIMTGFFLGMLTVALAANMRSILGDRFFGLGVGLGTGSAYAISNLPYLFEGHPASQILSCSIITLFGSLAILLVKHQPANGFHHISTANEKSELTKQARVMNLPFFLIISCFFCLVWLDSAAFYVIQENHDLKALIWESNIQKSLIALSHLLAAVIAGLIIDQIQKKAGNMVISSINHVLIFAFLLLVFGYSATDFIPAFSQLSGITYAAGVSIYSTLLVALPCIHIVTLDKISSRWKSAFLYGLAGWVGSANGIGMAKELLRVPPLFFLITATVIMGSVMILNRRWQIVPLFILGAFFLLFSQVEKHPAQVEGMIGRQVYIREGCIHCHSQFVRDETRDTLMFGQASTIEHVLNQSPPLIGYRRQGPDLSHTAQRKPRKWQKNHLRQPRSVSPGTVMPSYDKLFAGNGEEGEALLDYLDTLE